MALAILKKILEEVEKQNINQAELWDLGDLARYLKMSKSYIQHCIIGKNGFPPPIVLPTTEKKGAKRWKSKEVKDWANKFRI
ncbi:hypothetical protein [Emcibacter sp.]|uniref:hypothetical protein n=1 Tax=Emcibacter sp. TaxID=1979954 RepID=UPI002AA6168D|nr:hypothetical protein [Emcibacter sp.]